MWVLSKFFRDADNNLLPVVTAYCGFYVCPRHPTTDDGWALVKCDMVYGQIDACKLDPDVVVLPQLFSSAAVPDAAITAYADWGATKGMTLGDFLLKLSETEPAYGALIQ